MSQKNTSRSNKQDDVESMMEISKPTPTGTYDPSGPMAFLQNLNAPITKEIEKYEDVCKDATWHELIKSSGREGNASTQDNLNKKLNTLKQLSKEGTAHNMNPKVMQSFIASYYLNEMYKTQPVPDPEASRAWLNDSLANSNTPRSNNHNNNAYPGSRDINKTGMFLANNRVYRGGQASRGQTMVAAAAAGGGGGCIPNPTTRSRSLFPQQQQPAYRSTNNINTHPLLPPLLAPRMCDQCVQEYQGEGRVGRVGPDGHSVTFCLNCATTNTKFQPMRQHDARSRGGGGGEQLLACVQPGSSIGTNPRGFYTLNSRPADNNNNSSRNGLGANSGMKAPLALVNITTGGRPESGEQQQLRRQRKKPQGTDDNPINLISDDEEDTTKKSRKQKQQQQQQQQGEDSPPSSSPPIAISGRQRTLRQTTLNTRKAMSMKTEEKLKGLKCLYPLSGGPGSVELNALDVARLDEYEFLNDSVIDYYIKWMQSDIPEDIASRCYFFNTFFYKKLTERNYHALPPELEQYKLDKNLRNLDLYALMNHEKVKKWTKDTDIFSKDYIFIPVHMDLHWSLIIVCNPGLWDPSPPSSLDDNGTDPRVKPRAGPVLIHLDSLSGGHSSKPACDIVRRYLWFEWVSKMRALQEQKQQQEANGGGGNYGSRLTAYQRWEKTHPGGDERVFDDKTFPYKRAAAPRQDNYCDCGLFVLTNMEFFIRRLPETINVAAITALKEKYDKDNIDLHEKSSSISGSGSGNGSGSGRDTEYGTFPGMLTSYWYLPQNASNLRWRVRYAILQLLGEQNHLYDRERNTFVPMDDVPVKMRELRKNIEEEFDLVTALTINNPYYSPKNEEYVEEHIKNKKARNVVMLQRMQVQEDRRKQEREEKKKRREAAARAADARVHLMKPDEDFAIDIDDADDDDDDDDDDDEEDELEKSQRKAMQLVRSSAEEQRRRKKRRVTNVIQDSDNDNDNDDDEDNAAFAAQFQMIKGCVGEKESASDGAAAKNTKAKKKKEERKSSIEHWEDDDDIGGIGNEEAAFVIGDDDKDEDYYEAFEGDDSDEYMEAEEERNDDDEEEEDEEMKEEKKEIQLKFDKDKSAAAKKERRRQKNKNEEGGMPVEKIKMMREKGDDKEEVIMIDSDDDGTDNQGGGRPVVTRTLSDLQNDRAANGPLHPGMKIFQRKAVRAKQVLNRGGEGGRVRKEMSGVVDTIKNALAMPMGDARRMKKNLGGGFPISSIEEERL